MDSERLFNRIVILEAYGNIHGIDSWSPNLVADVALNYFNWRLSSDEIVFISDHLN